MRTGAERDGGPESVALHDARGFVSFTLRPAAQGYVFTDHLAGSEGRVLRDGGGRLVAEVTGQPPVRAVVPTEGTLEIRTLGTLSLRLQRQPDGARLADHHEIPRGHLRRHGAAVRIYDAGGALTAQLNEAGGRLAVTDRNGAPLGFITGAVTIDRAARAYLPGLTPTVKALLLVSGPP